MDSGQLRGPGIGPTHITGRVRHVVGGQTVAQWNCRAIQGVLLDLFDDLDRVDLALGRGSPDVRGDEDGNGHSDRQAQEGTRTRIYRWKGNEDTHISHVSLERILDEAGQLGYCSVAKVKGGVL